MVPCHFLLATLLLSVLAFAAFLLLDVVDAAMTATTTVATSLSLSLLVRSGRRRGRRTRSLNNFEF